jgi:predicted ATPase
MLIKQTNWYVLTGGPCSGKTTTINIIANRGYKTTIEHARHYIDTQQQNGRTIEEIRKNQEEFQMGVLEMQIEQEAILDSEELVFLDRAIPDALAYFRYLHLPVNKRLTDALEKCSYKKIFILDYLPLVQDYARREDAEAQKIIHNLMIEVYNSLSFPIVSVPILTPEERADYILNNL